MSYQKQTWHEYDDTKTELQNLNNGAMLTAERLNHMESGIFNAYTDADIIDVYRHQDEALGVGIGKDYDPILGGKLQVGGTAIFEKIKYTTDVSWVYSDILQNGYTGYIRYRKIGETVTVMLVFVKVGSSDRLTGTLQIFQLPTSLAPTYSIWEYSSPSPTHTSYPELQAAVVSMTANTGQIHIHGSSNQGIQFAVMFTYHI